jgi:hypothetical protein
MVLVALLAAIPTWLVLRTLRNDSAATAAPALTTSTEEAAGPEAELTPRPAARREAVETPAEVITELAAVRIVGVVREEGGSPLAGVNVWMRDQNGARAETSSSADGTFAFAEQPPGACMLGAHAPGYARKRHAIVVPATRAEHLLELRLERELLVRLHFVDESGTALARTLAVRSLQQLGFGAIATAEPPPARLPTIGGPHHRRFGLGELRFEPDASSEGRETVFLALRTPPPLYLSATWRNFVVSTIRIDALPESVELLVPSDTRSRLASTLRVRLLDGTSGKSIEDAKVTCDSFNQEQQRGERDLDGFLVRSVSPGLNRLCISAEGLASFTRILVVEPASALDLGTFVLEAPRALPVEVQDARGERVDAIVTAYELGANEELPLWLYHQGATATSRSETHELENLRPTRYLVTAASQQSGAKARAVIDLRERAEQPLTLVLRPTTSLVVQPRFAPSDAPLLRIVDAHSIPIYEYFAQVNGEMLIRVEPGNYHIQIWDDENLARTILCRVEGRATTVVVSR